MPDDRPQRFFNLDPTWAPTYREQFEIATEFSCSLGYQIEKLKWSSEAIVPVNAQAFIEATLREAHIDDLCKSAAQCLKWSAWTGQPLLDIFES